MKAPRAAAMSKLVADGEPGVQIAAGGAVVFALDGDPVVAGIGWSREGVVAQHGPLPVVGLDPQREVLAGARGRERCAGVRVLEPDGDHRIALALDDGDGESAERRARPGADSLL